MVSTAERGPARLSREDWVDTAFEALADRGIEGVRIDRLCRQLGVTKGSFYHHFGSRDELLVAMAEYWADTQPREAMDMLSAKGDPPARQLAAVTRLVADRDIGRRDHAMRAWAAADDRAARAVQQADQRILALLEGILAVLGVPRVEVFPLSRVLFFTALGSYDAPLVFEGRSRGSLSRYLLRLVEDRARPSRRSTPRTTV